MQALIIILNKTEYTETVIELLTKSGIRGATILEGLGSRAKSNRQLTTGSFLASIVESLEQRNEVKKIILSVVEKDSQVDCAVTAINEQINCNDDGQTSAFMFTLPINYMRGGELERHIVRRDGKYMEKGD